MQVVIVAGGAGSRMVDHLGRGVPKIGAPIGKTRFLFLLLDKLHREGAMEVVFCLGHLADEVRRLARVWQEHDGGFDRLFPYLEFHEEAQPLGSGGALQPVLPYLGQQFLLLWGDVFPVWNLGQFYDTVMRAGGPTTVTVSNGWYRNNKTFHRLGYNRFQLDLTCPPRELDNGVYFINKADYERVLRQHPPHRGLRPYDLWDVMPALLDNPEIPSRLYNVGNMRVHDVGEPERFHEFEDELTRGWLHGLKLRWRRYRMQARAVLESGSVIQ